MPAHLMHQRTVHVDGFDLGLQSANPTDTFGNGGCPPIYGITNLFGTHGRAGTASSGFCDASIARCSTVFP
jgi:hypothetical protein